MLNRKEKRRFVAQQRKTITRAVRVHEAGHCIGRMTIADYFGYEPEEMIAHVDLGPSIDTITEHEGVVYISQGCSFGWSHTAEMAEFLAPRLKERMASGAPVAPTVEDFDDMRAAGIDLERWLLCRYIFCIAGPKAESKFTGTPLELIMSTAAGAGDRNDMIRDSALLRMEPRADLAVLAEQFLVHVFDQPDMWAATLAIADGLTIGRTTGERVADIAASHIESMPCPDLDSAFPEEPDEAGGPDEEDEYAVADCAMVALKEGDDVRLYLFYDGKRIAKRGEPDTPQAKTWVSIEPGYTVHDNADMTEIEIRYQGVAVH